MTLDFEREIPILECGPVRFHLDEAASRAFHKSSRWVRVNVIFMLGGAATAVLHIVLLTLCCVSHKFHERFIAIGFVIEVIQENLVRDTINDSFEG